VYKATLCQPGRRSCGNLTPATLAEPQRLGKPPVCSGRTGLAMPKQGVAPDYFGNLNCTCARICQLAPSSGCTML
jgi:hypothetical protein